MILHVDIPHDGPQVLAFRVPTEPLLELRRGLQAAYERGDGRGLARLWEALVPAHRRALRRARWRVPPETYRQLLEGIEARCHEALTPVVGVRPRMGPPPREECLSLAATCRARLDRLKSEPIDFVPGRWLWDALRIRYRLRLGWNPAEGCQPLGFEWQMWERWLAEFDARLTPHEWDEEHLEEPVDEALLARVAQVQFLHTTIDPATFAATLGEPIEVEEAASDPHQSNHLRFADGETYSSMGAWESACRAMRVTAILEASIGPWVHSRGPGPFVPVPKAAQPLAAQEGDPLALYRYGWLAGRQEEAARWWSLSGADALERALEEIPDQPVRVWQWHVPRLHDDDRLAWVGWEIAAESHWTRCRERWVALLTEAKGAGDSVVLTHWLPNDQGTLVSPLEDDLGTAWSLPALQLVE